MNSLNHRKLKIERKTLQTKNRGMWGGGASQWKLYRTTRHFQNGLAKLRQMYSRSEHCYQISTTVLTIGFDFKDVFQSEYSLISALWAKGAPVRGEQQRQ
jgi:hypothetical protein